MSVDDKLFGWRLGANDKRSPIAAACTDCTHERRSDRLAIRSTLSELVLGVYIGARTVEKSENTNQSFADEKVIFRS